MMMIDDFELSLKCKDCGCKFPESDVMIDFVDAITGVRVDDTNVREGQWRAVYACPRCEGLNLIIIN